MKYIQSLRIPIKMGLLSIIPIIAILLLQINSAITLKDNLFKDRESEIRSAVELAYDTVDFFYRQQKDGILTEQQAQEQSLQAIRSMSYQKNQYYFITDMNATILAHGANSKLEGKNLMNLQDPNGIYILREVINQVKQQGSGFVHYSWNKPGADKPAAKITFAKGHAAWKWSIATGLYVDDVDAIFIQNLVHTALILLGVLAILIPGNWYIAHSITKPIRALLQTMGSVSDQMELKQRAKIDNNDEIGQIAHGFNVMLDKIHPSLFQVSETVHKLSASASQLMQVSQTSQQQAQKQSDDIEHVASAMTRISNTVKEVSRNTDLTAENTRDTHQIANSSYHSMLETKSAISKLSNNIQHAAQVIDGVENDSKNIGSILDVIRGIADQTNLLALNAAIEAARAGEQGRGFAVVADEVRTLAQRTQDSITEIEKMIKNLQEGSYDAVTVMQESQQTAAESVERVSVIAEALNQINQNIDSINKMSSQIAISAEEQSRMASEINQNISSITEGAEVNNQESQKVSDASQEMAGVAESLTLAIAGFRL